MAPLLGYLAENASGSGWEEIEWFCAPHARLDGLRPADMLARDAYRVVHVLHAQYFEDPDARW